MAKEVHSVSESGMSTTSTAGDHEITIDATGEGSMDTLETLLADYAACYVPALRVGAEQRGVDDLGHIEIGVTGELNDDDKLDGIAFDVAVEADVGGKGDAIVERADELCKVHDALKPSLHADVGFEDGAF